ncbi:transposase Tn3 family protein, partial [mine drainage metagenome]
PLAILAEAWEKRGLGKGWGTGDRAAADGRTMETTESSLLAGFNRRHKRMGMTLYWVVRDDWLALKLAVIGTRDFEAWHLVDAVLQPDGGHGVRLVAGDTHGQQLAVWGLCYLLWIDLAARFHSLGRVKLYGNRREHGLPVEGVEPVRWSLVRAAIPSLARLVEAIRSRKMTAEEALRRGHVYDEEGVNVMEALRELGKAVRSRWVLRFAMSEDLRREVQDAL